VLAGPRPLPRRTALALGVAAIAVAGCDDGDSSDPAGVSTSTPEADPDVALVDSVLDELEGAERLAYAGGFNGLAALHRAHIAALDGEETMLAPGHATKDTVRRNEVRMQRVLARAAMTAESGALAQLFASMAAAGSQRLAPGGFA
jgi:hypothetical protein